jgi:hypothetical protein
MHGYTSDQYIAATGSECIASDDQRLNQHNRHKVRQQRAFNNRGVEEK